MGEIGEPKREEPWVVPAPPAREPVKEPSPTPVPERPKEPVPA